MEQPTKKQKLIIAFEPGMTAEKIIQRVRQEEVKAIKNAAELAHFYEVRKTNINKLTDLIAEEAAKIKKNFDKSQDGTVAFKDRLRSKILYLKSEILSAQNHLGDDDLCDVKNNSEEIFLPFDQCLGSNDSVFRAIIQVLYDVHCSF